MTAARTLEIGTLEGWLWNAACQIRGPVDAPKFKDYILPLVFLKRLSDVFEDEVARLGEELGSEEIARQIVDGDHSTVRLYLPLAARWSEIGQQTTGVAILLHDLMTGKRRVHDLEPTAADVAVVGKGP